MKSISFTLLAALGLAGSYLTFRPAPEPPPVDPATLHEGNLTMSLPPEDVFKRALWRKPAADDRILHAERREWAQVNAKGVAQWQWFLAVEPGVALKKWLREENPFPVHPAGSAALADVEGPPAWFPRDLSGYEIHAGGTKGSLVFLYSRDGKTLYATSSGKGFTPGAPEPAAVPVPLQASGRLPLTPPPNPSNP